MSQVPFHADHVGSIIRPKHLLESIAKFKSGEISREELTQIEDEAIKKVVEQQVAVGLKIVSDGEYRRDMYWLDFWLGFPSVEEGDFPFADALAEAHGKKPDTGLVNKFPFHVPVLKGKIQPNPSNPEFNGFKYLKSVTPEGVIPKVIIPSPNFVFLFRPKNDPYPSEYKSWDEFYADLALVLHESLLTYYSLGARYVQIDDPTWLIFPMLIASAKEERIQAFKHLVNSAVTVYRQALKDLPSDLHVGLHTCRGNGDLKWEVPYNYEDVTPLFQELNFSWLLLEFDDQRSGKFSDLQKLAETTKTRLFLGVVTTKSPVVEEPETIEKTIREAAKVIPLEQIGLCPQCGFATKKECINDVTEEAQWKKLKLIVDVASKIWPNQ